MEASARRTFELVGVPDEDIGTLIENLNEVEFSDPVDFGIMLLMLVNHIAPGTGFEMLVRERAAITLQAAARGYLARKRFAELKEQRKKEEEAAILIQSRVRGFLARNEYAAMKAEHELLQKQEQAATQIQSAIRGYLARKEEARLKEEVRLKEEARLKEAAITLQSAIRGLQARRELGSLRRDKLRQDQRAAAKRVADPSLQLTDKLLIGPCDLLDAYDTVVRKDMVIYYDWAAFVDNTKSWHSYAQKVAKKAPIAAVAVGGSNWKSIWAMLRWEDWCLDKWSAHFNAHLVKGSKYPILGQVTLGGTTYWVEFLLWVKASLKGRASRYNQIGDALAILGNPAIRAANIRKALTGSGSTPLEQEAALAMFGAETARNPRAYGIGLMLLDLVENGATYGSGKNYAWDSILGSKLHFGESNGDFEKRKKGISPLNPHRQQRWTALQKGVALLSFKLRSKPFYSLWAGKWPMSPTGSMALGSTTITVPKSPADLNVVQYKEIKILVQWLIYMLDGLPLKIPKNKEGEVLALLFEKRLETTVKFTPGHVEGLLKAYL